MDEEETRRRTAVLNDALRQAVGTRPLGRWRVR